MRRIESDRCRILASVRIVPGEGMLRLWRDEARNWISDGFAPRNVAHPGVHFL